MSESDVPIERDLEMNCMTDKVSTTKKSSLSTIETANRTNPNVLLRKEGNYANKLHT